MKLCPEAVHATDRWAGTKGGHHALSSEARLGTAQKLKSDHQVKVQRSPMGEGMARWTHGSILM